MLRGWWYVLLYCLLKKFGGVVVVFGYNNGQAQLPALGWNTWCSTFFCGSDICSEDQVTQTATAMLQNGMYKLGYKHINLDDCWAAETRDEDGNLQADKHRFPSGMANLTKWLHQNGFLFGLYTSAGDKTCSSGRRLFKPPGSYGHYQQDANTFAAWEIDYVKIDWCGQDLYNAQEQHTEFSQALNNTGRSMWLELCRGYGYPPPPYVAQVANSWRVTGDHHDHWRSTIAAIEAVAGDNVTGMSAEYNWAYNDFLMTGGQGCPTINPNVPAGHCPGQTPSEYRSEFAIWSISASPLIVATDVRIMTDTMNEVLLNEEILAVNQQNETPAGKRLGTNFCVNNATDPNCQVWMRNLNDGSVAVCLFNTGEEKQPIQVELSELNYNWNSTTKVTVRDLWAHQDMGTYIGQFQVDVDRHDNAFVTMQSQ